MELVSGMDDGDDGDDDISGVDIIGGEDIVGVLDIIGATKSQRARAMQVLRARELQRGNTSTVASMGAKSRRLFLGASVANITSQAPVIVTIKAQEDYRPDRIVVSAVDTNGVVDPSAIEISDVRIGTRSQFASIGNITADLFARDFFANGADLGLDTIQAGTDLSLEVIALLAGAQNATRVNVSCVGRALR
jgi:hypothetical protein